MNPSHLVRNLYKHLRILKGRLSPHSVKGRFFGAKIVINSIPKSGSNLLLEIVLSLPSIRGKNSKTLTLRNGLESLVKELQSAKKGQVVGAHFPYKVTIDSVINLYGIRHILIIRDFRDSLYSNINYLDKVHIMHPHNVAYKELTSLDQKIDLCLSGRPELGMLGWPEMIRQYRSWLVSENTLIVRYEHLISADRSVIEMELAKIVDWLGFNGAVDLSEMRRSMINSWGLTFNQPGIEKWRKVFNQAQISKLKQALGEELVYFGYVV